SSVARLNFATLLPLGVERISGSFPSRPTRMTLLTLAMLAFSWSDFNSKDAIAFAFLRGVECDVSQHRDVMADAAGHHAEMPHAVHVHDAFGKSKEDDSDRVDDSTRCEPGDPCGRKGALQGSECNHDQPAHQKVERDGDRSKTSMQENIFCNARE